jgi:hypothetical protein
MRHYACGMATQKVVGCQVSVIDAVELTSALP